ncbi:hypothetical protein OAM90_02865 [Flavobacteriaceae bacterium]|nr:hypothetical protein [Flavobacteriaceae bacterium]
MPLINFNKAHSYLDTIGVPRLEEYDSNVIIDRIDFTEQENDGNIEWREDGVYLNIRGAFQRGFMYIKRPYLTRYNKNIAIISDRPRFHILNCSTIEQQRSEGRFDNRYFWSNSATISLFDFDTHEEFPNKALNLCYNCQELLNDDIANTEVFHNLLDLNDNKIENNTEETETDIFKRPLNWRSISKAYREEQNYTCEECGFGGSDLENNYDKRYLHTHHIDSYDLLNTHRNNLKSVCVLCHYNQDEHHQSNFEKPRLKRELKSFVNKYRNRLIEIGNKHIDNYK